MFHKDAFFSVCFICFTGVGLSKNITYLNVPQLLDQCLILPLLSRLWSPKIWRISVKHILSLHKKNKWVQVEQVYQPQNPHNPFVNLPECAKYLIHLSIKTLNYLQWIAWDQTEAHVLANSIPTESLLSKKLTVWCETHKAEFDLRSLCTLLKPKTHFLYGSI